ncbi:MAG TPA: hypothetical protein VNY52_01790 [Solirubrobacteraceae bacterium]|jgi:hypothetical protein|nr:hypothetical protein [Solirubrobacteraceae bacterium]
MSKLGVAVGLLASVWVMTVAATPALAAFEAKETKENSARIETGESPVSFKVEALEVTCERVSGEGTVLEERGQTGIEAKEDEPPKTSIGFAPQVSFKMKFEKCKDTAGEEKGNEVIISDEKCRVEVYQAEETEQGLLSLRAAEKGTQCKMTLEVPKKCKIELDAESVEENENLTGLKLKNKNEKEFEVEVESKSEVKAIQASTKECKGVGAKPEAQLIVNKPIVIKNIKLLKPLFTVSTTELNFNNTMHGGGSETKVVKYKSDNNGLMMGNAAIMTEGSNFERVTDNCSGATLNNAVECEIKVRFKPANAVLYTGVLLLGGVLGADVTLSDVRLRGKGT